MLDRYLKQDMVIMMDENQAKDLGTLLLHSKYLEKTAVHGYEVDVKNVGNDVVGDVWHVTLKIFGDFLNWGITKRVEDYANQFDGEPYGVLPFFDEDGKWGLKIGITGKAKEEEDEEA